MMDDGWYPCVQDFMIKGERARMRLLVSIQSIFAEEPEAVHGI